jgi:hypothetical protein
MHSFRRRLQEAAQFNLVLRFQKMRYIKVIFCRSESRPFHIRINIAKAHTAATPILTPHVCPADTHLDRNQVNSVGPRVLEVRLSSRYLQCRRTDEAGHGYRHGEGCKEELPEAEALRSDDTE